MPGNDVLVFVIERYSIRALFHPMEEVGEESNRKSAASGKREVNDVYFWSRSSRK